MLQDVAKNLAVLHSAAHEESRAFAGEIEMTAGEMKHYNRDPMEGIEEEE
jgi:hypothetical protein